MKRKELNQLYYLGREIKMLERKQKELTIELNETGLGTTDSVTGSSASFPYTLHSVTVAGIDIPKYYKLKAEIADVNNLILLNKEKCICEYNRMNRYIQSVDDSMIRQILTYRFIDCLPWSKVAIKIGGDNTADGVKKACYRYLENH